MSRVHSFILDEEIYMEQLKGFKIHGQEQKVLHLHRAIYGLKQAALAWWKELLTSMRKIGFERSQSDAGIFIHKASNRDIVIAMIYINNSGFMGNNMTLVKKKKKHSWAYENAMILANSMSSLESPSDALVAKSY